MRFVLLVAMLLLAGGCARDGAPGEANVLDLGSENDSGVNSASADAAPITASVPALKPRNNDGSGTSARAVLKVGRDYVADAQAALLPTSVIAYCKSFVSVLSQPGDLRDCLRLVDIPQDIASSLPTPDSSEALLAQAAVLPVVQRFALCTSDQALPFIASMAEYERCMPPSLEGQLERELGEAKAKALDAAGVGPPAFPYSYPLSSASQLSAEERVAYCGIPDVAGQLVGEDKANCLKGINAAEQTIVPAPANPDDSAISPAAVLANASQMRSQSDRDALCNRANVKAALTPAEYRECVAGLSPRNPPRNVLTDDDPGYRDEGN